jgi:hypothetical protein
MVEHRRERWRSQRDPAGPDADSPGRSAVGGSRTRGYHSVAGESSNPSRWTGPMKHEADRAGRDAKARAKRYWPDSVFRDALVFWLVLGLTSILKTMLFDRPSVAHVLLVAWGVVVIFVLWFRMGPPRQSSRGNPILR